MMKEKARLEPDSEVYIDCFYTVISLEIAFSDSTLLLCMDGIIRDLRFAMGADSMCSVRKYTSAILAGVLPGLFQIA